MSLGAEVLFEGTTTIERKARAEAIAAERGMTIVPPFDHVEIAAGQGTIGLEIVEQCPSAATVYVQMSGGGLIAGVATALKRSKPGITVVGVEPTGVAQDDGLARGGSPGDRSDHDGDCRRAAGGAPGRPDVPARAGLRRLAW